MPVIPLMLVQTHGPCRQMFLLLYDCAQLSTIYPFPVFILESNLLLVQTYLISGHLTIHIPIRSLS